MFPIPEDLAPSDKNKLISYLPIRNKGNDFDWDIITGMVLGHALKKQIKQYDFEQFREDCKRQFITKMDQPDFWEVLDRMYFASEAVFDISPLFLLFKAQRKGSGKSELGAANVRMGDLFCGLLGCTKQLDEVNEQLNFLEHQMLLVLQRKLSENSDCASNEQHYLPYIAKAFQEDINFLATHPKYLLRELTNTLRLYAFSYCTQMALNVSAWKDGEPVSKPLYFILDTERASTERINVNHGYKMFAQFSEGLFPILSALEAIQHKDFKRPLWQVYKDSIEYADRDGVLRVLNEYIDAFAKSRELDGRGDANTVETAFEHLIGLAVEQFKVNKTTRGEINEKYTKELEKQICGDFVQTRGRAGRVLVLNQDQLLLLTNLSIGLREKLRLHELMEEFRRRGFYLDGQTQQVLVSFYERMGNVERMSDSGDAVYVRKTV
ncbi:DNA phosphorothioation-dependent restriction protein DptG [Azonexus sp. IMCC34842]|uniref:DNA phosphorothioation-dependent restriction protein DptG n=1 Tax=Azonexus sp. IMCC34842 TaxID=3420950 RepID=UPI003D0C7701